jgi:hypothetical protein
MRNTLDAWFDRGDDEDPVSSAPLATRTGRVDFGRRWAPSGAVSRASRNRRFSMADFTSGLARSLFAFVIAAALLLPLTAASAPGRVFAGSDNVAIKGYDAVAYFTMGEPKHGKPEFAFAWNEVQWHFVSAAHRDLFAASPERYAPQFGGYCSMALTRGQLAGVEPEVWTIVEGKLYLNVNRAGREKFRQNVDENIQKAGENWARIHK